MPAQILTSTSWSDLNFDSIMALATRHSLAAAIVLSFMILMVLVFRKNSKRFPPRPPACLFQPGNTFRHLYQIFPAIHKRYGPIFSFYRGSTPVIVLGKMKQAVDLLDKRGATYSSRPRNIMAGEILSGYMRGFGMPYGPRWRNYRSLMNAGMGVEASQKYKALQKIESSIVLRDLLEETNQQKYDDHLYRFAVSIAIFVSYGRRISDVNDPLVVAHQKIEQIYLKFNTPGKYLVESWPILLYLPRALQWFRHEAEAQRARDTELYLGFLMDVRRKMETGTVQHCTARYGLEKQAQFGLTDVELAYALSSPFTAGVGSTLYALHVFLLAMLHNPRIMRRAQAEIDNLVDSHRLPDFDDLESLPYVVATIKEALRWRPVVPLGVPHSTIQEDTYEGMHIPKGSTVLANLWGISKDEELFPSPEDFDPDRYYHPENSGKKGHSHQSTFYFGFGRRICPGMHVAQNTLFIIASRLLWAFDIMPGVDEGGKPILPSKDDFIGASLTIQPRPFFYDLRFRRNSEDRALLLNESKKAEEEALAWT